MGLTLIDSLIKFIIIMKKTLSIFFLLTCTYSFSQNKVRIIDIESGDFIKGAKIKTNNISHSDAEGFFILDNNYQGKIELTHDEYDSLQIHTNQIENGEIFLMRKYEHLNEVFISSKKLELEDIFKKVEDNIHKNYLTANFPLIYSHHCLISNNSDTGFFISMPVLTHHKSKNKIFAYYNYFIPDSVMIKNTDPQILSKYYRDHINFINITKSFEKLFNSKYAKEQKKQNHILYSSFTKNDMDYLDIIFISKEPLDPKDYLFRYKEKEIKNIKVYSVMNFQINFSNYSFEIIRAFIIPIFSDKIETVLDIKNREDFNNCLKEISIHNLPHSKTQLKFEKLESENKYIISHYDYFSNLQLLKDDEDNNSKYNFYRSWTFDRKSENGWDEKWEFLFGYFNVYKYLLEKKL